MSTLDDRREPRFAAGDDGAIESRIGPVFGAEPDYGPQDDRDLDEMAGERTPWGLRVSVIGGAIALAVGVGLVVVSLATATIGVRAPTGDDEATLASESLEPVELSAPSDGAPGMRNVLPFGSDTASSTATPVPTDNAGPSEFSAAEAEPATPPPAPRTRPDRPTVASTDPSTGPAAARSDATVSLTAPAAPPAEAGTDGLIANIERILDQGRPAGTVDGPAMDALPPAGGLDAAATGAIVLPPPGTASPGEPYGPPSPYPPTAELYGPPPYPPPPYPPGTDPFAPRIQPGQLYIPPAPGAPVPPAEIPGLSASTGVF